MTQRELETQFGASRQPPLPVTCHAYVVSSLLAPARLEFTLYPQSAILLLSGCLILGGGFILLEFRLARHPGVLVAVALAVWTGTALFPLQASLFARAGVLSGLLVAAAYGVNVWQERRRGSSRIAIPSEVRPGEPISGSGEASWSLSDSVTPTVVHSNDSVGSRG